MFIFFFFFKQKTAYEIMPSLVGSEMCIRDSNSLIAAVDVFVSLHRAEGFGLVMAEAMLLDTVCVATDWSSNTEFMDADSACMVSFQKVEIQETSGNYKKGCRWAEPDVEEAAGYMRRLYEDPAYYDLSLIHI